MPIFGTTNTLGFDTVTPIPNKPIERERPTGSEIIQAAWESHNIIGSTLSAMRNFQMPGEVDPNFNIREHITGFEDHAEAFIGARNEDDVQQVKARITRENKNREILSNNDFSGMLTATVIGSLDPTWLIPGSFASTRALQAIEGSSILRTSVGALGGAAAIASTVALQEGALWATQLTKPSQEILHNTLYAAAGGAILGGLAGYLTGPQRKAFDKAVLEAGTTDFTTAENPFMGPMKPQVGPTPNSSTGALYRDLDRVLDPVTAEAVKPARVGSLKKEEGWLGWLKENTVNRLFDWTPQGQAARSRFETIQKLGPQIYHNDFLRVMHLEGHALDAALETLLDVNNHQMKSGIRNALEEYVAYTKRMEKEGLKALPIKEFGQEVMQAHRFHDKHLIPEVAKSATHLRVNYDRNFERGVEQGLARKKPKIHTAESWAPRIPNKLKMTAERYMTLAKEGISGPVERISKYLEDVNARINQGEKVYTKAGADLMHEAQLARNSAQEFLENIKKNAGSAKVRLNAAQQAEISALLKEAQTLEIKAAENTFKTIPQDQIFHRADEIVDTYLGIDLHHKTGHKFNAKYAPDALKPGTFKEREFMIPDELFKDYWIDDAFEASYRHHMSTSPYLTTAEFLKNSGLGSIENVLKELGQEYKELRKTVSGRDARLLQEEYEAAQKYVTESFELMTGQFDRAIDHPGWRRFGDALNAYTSARLLGGTPIAALDDAGRVLFSRGLEAIYEDGWRPMMEAFSDPKLDVRHWQDYNISIDSTLGFLRHAGDDIHQLYGQRSKLERFLKFAGTDVHKWSGMELQTKLLEEIYGRASFSGNLRNIMALADPKEFTPKARALWELAQKEDRLFKLGQVEVDKLTREGMAKLGFDKRDYAQYINNYAGSGGTIYKGAYLPTNMAWPNKRLEQNFRAAIQKDLTQTIIKPTKGDIPFFGHRKLGKSLLKIRTFQFAALNKTTIPFLQRRDAGILSDLVIRMNFGLLSYAIASKARDPFAPLHDNWRDLAHEAIDRSALTGVLMEGYNMGTKLGLVDLMTQGHLGKGEGSRYQSRGPISAIVGPNVGMVEDIYQTIRAATKPLNDPDKSYSTNDAARAFHLLPYVRVWYFRYILEQAARGLAKEMGAAESPVKSTRRQ